MSVEIHVDGALNFSSTGRYSRVVGVYRDGQHREDVAFKYKWQALVFHLLLNRSYRHNGTRYY